MVYVYIKNVKNLPDPWEVPAIMDGLPESRKQKICALKQLDARKQSLGAGLLLQQVLSMRGRDSAEVTCDTNGKPMLDGIYFNLSHSHEIVVCAISELPVGCDVEKVQSGAVKVAGRFFTEHEKAYLERFSETERIGEFFRLWTMKESYIKMTGEGMRLALDRFEIVIAEETSVYRDGERSDCFIKEYEIPGYKLSVCAREREFAMDADAFPKP